MRIPIGSRQDVVHRSPPPGALAIVHVGLFVASIAALLMMTGGAPNPYKPVEELQDYFTRFPGTMRVVSFLLFGASIPLGLFTATMVSRLMFHRIRVAGVYIALFGGLAAAAYMGMSSMAMWALSQPGVAGDIGAMRAVQLVSFAAGGVGYTVTLGLLLAGVSIPSLVFRLMPRWVCWLGLVVAGIAELSVFSMLSPAASFLLPLARFPALVWLIAAGMTMPKRRIPMREDLGERETPDAGMVASGR